MISLIENLKISIAGARLSHLVGNNLIWDHGSMVEQVKTVFMHLNKAHLRNDAELVKKCTTETGYQKVKKIIESGCANNTIGAELLAVKIIAVAPAKRGQPDKFTALLKTKTHKANISPTNLPLLHEEWVFIHHNWWLLHDIIIKEKISSTFFL